MNVIEMVKAKTGAKAFFYAVGYFIISGLMPLLTQAVASIFDAIIDFEPRTVIWLLIVGSIVAIFVFIEKLNEEDHPTGAGVCGVLRYIVGVVDVTLYYNLLLSVGIFVPTVLPNPAVTPFGLIINFNIVFSAVFFSLYLMFLGFLIYGGYVLNFTRYFIQMKLGFKLTDG